MKTLGFIILTGIINSIIGAVILIKVGGWLPVLVAILSLVFMMLISGITIIAFTEDAKKKTGGIKQ